MKLIIADEREQNRDGIESALRNEEPYDIVPYATTGKEVLELLTTTVADIVIIHFNIPVLGGVETAKAIKEIYPKTKVLLTLDKVTPENVRSIKYSAASG